MPVYTLIKTHGHWLKLGWRGLDPPFQDAERMPLTVEIIEAFEFVRALPGVTGDRHISTGLLSGSIELPRTVFFLPEVAHLMDLCGLRERFDALALGPVMAPPRHTGTAMVVQTGLYPWQREGHEAACYFGGQLCAFEMGLGKTATAIATAEAVMQVVGAPTFIIAPTFGRTTWANELVRVGAICTADELLILQGRDPEKAKFDGYRWVFINYEIAADWQFRLSGRGPRPALVILDEAHRIKNPNAKCTKAAMMICGLSRWRGNIALTGTPLENRPRELWPILTAITGPQTWGSVSDFRRRYCGAVQGQFGLEDSGVTNLPELRARMAPWYLRKTKAELPVGSLPALARNRIDVELDAASAEKHASQLAKYPMQELLDAILGGRAGENALAAISTLRQITSKAKESTTVDFVSALLEQGESVVVFAWQRQTVRRLASKWARMHPLVFEVSGEHTEAERANTVERFSASSRPSVIVATYGTLREGVNLTRAAQGVLHDLDWKTSTILQAEARWHRLGQRRPTTSTWIVAKDSIDTVFARLLTLKAGYIRDILDDGQAVEALDELNIASLLPSQEASMQDWVDVELSSWLNRRGS